jgi:environmental stress-induced protein Ves
MNLVRCDAVEPQPWRNGGGLTRELLAWPHRSHQGKDWALRISVADIHADGPFSAFPGVDRWFAVLQGNGVLLGLPEGRRSVAIADAPLAFRGEAAPRCELLDGPTRDLNLMLRRDAGRGGMQRAQVGDDFAPRARFRALFTADALMLQIDGSDALHVPAFALAWDAGTAQGIWRIAADAPVRAWWMRFEPRPA